jgi:hypothetical protein
MMPLMKSVIARMRMMVMMLMIFIMENTKLKTIPKTKKTVTIHKKNELKRSYSASTLREPETYIG